MTLECVNVTFVLSTKVNLWAKIVVVKITQEITVHLQCTHICFGIPLDVESWHYAVTAWWLSCKNTTCLALGGFVEKRLVWQNCGLLIRRKCRSAILYAIMHSVYHQ